MFEIGSSSHGSEALGEAEDTGVQEDVETIDRDELELASERAGLDQMEEVVEEMKLDEAADEGISLIDTIEADEET